MNGRACLFANRSTLATLLTKLCARLSWGTFQPQERDLCRHASPRPARWVGSEYVCLSIGRTSPCAQRRAATRRPGCRVANARRVFLPKGRLPTGLEENSAPRSRSVKKTTVRRPPGRTLSRPRPVRWSARSPALCRQSSLRHPCDPRSPRSRCRDRRQRDDRKPSTDP